jgi:hypothetical protein
MPTMEPDWKKELIGSAQRTRRRWARSGRNPLLLRSFSGTWSLAAFAWFLKRSER